MSSHSETGRLQVLFFSVLREKVGQEVYPLSLPLPATGEDLLLALEATFPQLAPYRAYIRLAVNDAYVSNDTPLADGDVVALITPVSGG